MNHERLECYQLARQYNRELEHLLRRSARTGPAAHIDQLRRSGASIALNLAEGYGEFSPREKARFYRMSKRSCTEAGSALDYLADLKVVREDEIRELKTLLRRIVAILVNLIRKVEDAAEAKDAR